MTNIRTCIVCRTKKNKYELLRIVAKENKAIVDDTKKQNTRAMYICNDKNCINKLLKAKDITKCIKIKVSQESLKELLKNLGE